MSKRYFKLTSEILLEYDYDNTENIDLNEHKLITINDTFIGANNVCFENYPISHNDQSSAVLPINKTESKFIKIEKVLSRGAKKYLHNDSFGDFSMNPISYTGKLKFNKVRLHFTSRDYFGDYDSLIIRAYIFNQIKTKISICSFIINRYDNIELNQNPMLINQKLYTKYIDVKLPNIEDISKYDNIISDLSPYKLLKNTPINVNIYGVKSSYLDNTNGYSIFNCEKLNTISIPQINNYKKIVINPKSAQDGDYFIIKPVVDDGKMLFSDYINNISDDKPESYIIFYEITLFETYLINNNPIIEATHTEQHILNIYDSDGNIDLNLLNKEILYRPVFVKCGKDYSASIKVVMKIFNSEDNTTMVIEGRLDEISEFKKYGKYMNKIYLGAIPSQINVYNRSDSADIDNIYSVNGLGGSNNGTSYSYTNNSITGTASKSGQVKIENHQHSVIGFIECANVGVTIEQLPITIEDNEE